MNSKNYQDKKTFYDKMLTIYGRKPVLEALQDRKLNIHRLHLANSNKAGGIINELLETAAQRNIEVCYHDKAALSRISRNAKQDQGVAADIHYDNYITTTEFLEHYAAKPDQQPPRLLALCDIHNPQNLGMIIRSACAGNIDGILIPRKGCASISPLVIKASTGTLFKATIIWCETFKDALQELKEHGFSVCALSSHATESLFEYRPDGPIAYVLGNESEGVSPEILKLADKKLMIPMQNGVESLNVAITAALIAFNDCST